jgi:osmotically-inducible protein OsmY
MSNFVLSSVVDELFRDPSVNSAAISVSAQGGHVTLRGRVPSAREIHDAETAARRVLGVTSVHNQLRAQGAGDPGPGSFVARLGRRSVMRTSGN